MACDVSGGDRLPARTVQGISCLLLAVIVSGAAFGSCLEWEARYDPPPPGNYAEARSVAVDSSGNTVTVGFETRNDLGQGNDWILRKYDKAGSLLWSRSYASPVHDDANGVAIAPDGTVVVAGTAGGWWMVRAYGADGADLWSNTMTGVWHANAAAVGPDGNVVVVGGFPFWVVRKYSPAGAILWTRTFTDAANPYDDAYGVAVGPAGDIVAVGQSSQGWCIRLYDAGGNDTGGFGEFHDGTPQDVATSVAMDAAGNLVVGGRIGIGMGVLPIQLKMYDHGGGVRWFRKLWAPYTATAVVVAGDARIYVGSGDGVVGVKSATGDQVWRDRFDDQGIYMDVSGLAIGPKGAGSHAGQGSLRQS